MLETWAMRAWRAKLLLVPINDKGHHWALLVAERSQGQGDEVPEAKIEDMVQGIKRFITQARPICDKCVFEDEKRPEDGCLACNQDRRDGHFLI